MKTLTLSKPCECGCADVNVGQAIRFHNVHFALLFLQYRPWLHQLIAGKLG
jgi:hypothetical protein